MVEAIGGLTREFGLASTKSLEQVTVANAPIELESDKRMTEAFVMFGRGPQVMSSYNENYM